MMRNLWEIYGKPWRIKLWWTVLSNKLVRGQTILNPKKVAWKVWDDLLRTIIHLHSRDHIQVKLGHWKQIQYHVPNKTNKKHCYN